MVPSILTTKISMHRQNHSCDCITRGQTVISPLPAYIQGQRIEMVPSSRLLTMAAAFHPCQGSHLNDSIKQTEHINILSYWYQTMWLR